MNGGGTNPRAILGIVIVAVYVITLFGAAATFRRVRSEYAWRTSLLALTFWVYAAAGLRLPVFLPGVLPGLLLMAAGLGLFQWGASVIRGHFFSIMGTSDTPEFVFDKGPFHYIRHPFYTSYLLMHAGVTLMYPHLLTIATLAATVLLVWNAASFEEAKFARSPLAEAYQDYTQRTGRFLPRLRPNG